MQHGQSRRSIYLCWHLPRCKFLRLRLSVRISRAYHCCAGLWDRWEQPWVQWDWLSPGWAEECKLRKPVYKSFFELMRQINAIQMINIIYAKQWRCCCCARSLAPVEDREPYRSGVMLFWCISNFPNIAILAIWYISCYYRQHKY